MQQRQQASPASRGRGPHLSLRGKEDGSGAPAPMLIASYRLWSSPPPAEPRCFPPSSHSSLGTQGAGEVLEGQPAQGRLAMGLAQERARRSARGVRRAGSERVGRGGGGGGPGARSGLQVRAEAGGGRRGRWAALGGGGARAGCERERGAWSRSRRPLPSPALTSPLPPAAESPAGGAGAGALATEQPDPKETGGDSRVASGL